MARSKCQTTVRLFLKLLLFVGIIQENLGVPTPISQESSPVPPFELEISSPVPFTTRKPEISIPETNKITFSPPVNGETPMPPLRPPQLPKVTDHIAKDLPDDDVEGNYDDDYIETDVQTVRTTPTSMEQQDGPVVPPTTITFSNVAAAGILGDTSANVDGGGGGGTSIIFNDATPPYAAVDDKYGKKCLIELVKSNNYGKM